MNVLDLCAGIGGLSLGLRAATDCRTVAYVEREAYAAAVLVSQMEAGALDAAPVWSDLRTFPAQEFRGCVDIITAGFPCQPHSLAGKRLGTADHRWLFDDIADIIYEVAPGIVFLENVPGLANTGLDRVLGSLASLGFDAEWGVFSAAEVGAPHWRKRLFILAAHAERAELWQQPRRCSGKSGAGEARPRVNGEEGIVANADRRRLKELEERNGEPSTGDQGKLGHDAERCGVGNANQSGPSLRQGKPNNSRAEQQAIERASWWATKSKVGRVADGFPGRVDQLRALGNAVVSATVSLAWMTLYGRQRARSTDTTHGPDAS